MKIPHNSKDIRKLFESYDNINKYHRRRISKNYRESQRSGYSIMQGLAYLFVVICGLGLVLWAIPTIGGV